MEKQAAAEHEIHPLLLKRWSPRAFVERELSEDQILSLLEAARWSPSCFNDQPWRYMVAPRGRGDGFARLLSTLSETNQSWAKRAGLLLLGVASSQFEHNGKPNVHGRYDLGQAGALLTVQAESMGLRVHQMAGFDSGRARAEFDIPVGFEPVVAIAVGYPDDPAVLPDTLREREYAARKRKPLSQIAFAGRFGDPFTAE